MNEEKKSGYEGWAIVELMGHRRLAGKVSEASIAGAPMLRLDVPNADGNGFRATQFYGGAALYCLTPTTEEIARRVASGNQPEPVSRWELPPPRSLSPPDAPESESDEAQEGDEAAGE